MSDAGIVIVGAGQAGSEVASRLRIMGYQGSITLLGDETYLPYRRPPLSKTYLSGEVTQESLLVKPQAYYDNNGISCQLGVRVQEIDRAARQVMLTDGSTLSYDKLVLATGGRARKLQLPGSDLPNVHTVRTITDILRMKEDFHPDARMVIIGGGYIGLEAAAVGIKKGLQVTVVETLPRVLARVTAPELSAFYERVHRAKGVNLLTGVGVHAFEGTDRVTAVLLSDGRRLDADLVVVGVGLIPNTELAEMAGVTVSNGVLVDATCRSSDPDIYAIGDCANGHNLFFGRAQRLESVPNALEQARVAASNLCGRPAEYAAVPWFWSDQYELKLQMVGLSQGYDQILIRGDMDKDSFIAFYLKDGVVISADSVNRAADFMVAKKLVAERVAVDPAKLVDTEVPLKSLMA